MCTLKFACYDLTTANHAINASLCTHHHVPRTQELKAALQSLAGEGCVLVLEMMKRLLVQGNRNRDTVVGRAMQVSFC